MPDGWDEAIRRLRERVMNPKKEELVDTAIAAETAPLKVLGKGLRMLNDVHGYSHGQTDGTLKAFIEDKLVGRLDWDDYANELRVKMVEVLPEFRRKGIATQMYDRLRQELPKSNLTHAMTTPEGTAFRRAYDSRK